jgi:uncharacterized protein (DUF362 family)
MMNNRREFIKKAGAGMLASAVPVEVLRAAGSFVLQQQPAQTATPSDWTPEAINKPVGTAQGIYPGRVAWAHAPGAAHWGGEWKNMDSPWWIDENTDQQRVTAMVADVVRKVSGKEKFNQAWKAIFEYHNRSVGRGKRGYRKDETVAVKINVNATGRAVRANNYSDVAPQTVYAVVEQLVKYAGVPENKILVYDAKRPVYIAITQKVWKDFKDVRFMQERELTDEQRHPEYGDHRRFELPDWVKGMQYSNGVDYARATQIPRQVKEATYIINLAQLKCHSYPYSNMEGGDEGQTAVTLLGKNHFGSILGPADLHAAVNTRRDAKSKTYSPIVDLAASPALGKKTILYMLDGLYCARKHSSYPMHFPNAPFFNRIYPYANPEWPSCILASLDGVALDSVGLDILYSQTKNNIDVENRNRPWMLIRENADDYLHEMATPENPPSGTKYVQEGKPVASLGVHEHWDSDETRRYSRNLSQNGKGIELIYSQLG